MTVGPGVFHILTDDDLETKDEGADIPIDDEGALPM